jgi:hypothetical protein
MIIKAMERAEWVIGKASPLFGADVAIAIWSMDRHNVKSTARKHATF